MSKSRGCDWCEFNILSGLCYAEVVTRPENGKYLMSMRALAVQAGDNDEDVDAATKVWTF